MQGCCALRRHLPAVSLVLAVGACALAGALFLLPPGQQALAADPPPQAVAGVVTKSQLYLAVQTPATAKADTLTVELLDADGKVLSTASEKFPRGRAAGTHRIELAAPSVPADKVSVRCRTESDSAVVSLDKILLARGHETSLVGSAELFAGSQASLRCSVRGVKSSTRTVPLRDAKVIVRLHGPGGKLLPLFTGTVDEDGSADVRFEVPQVPTGSYKMEVLTKSALGEEKLEREVRIGSQPKVLLNTDKPLYQPGQTIHLRALALQVFDLKPVKGDLLIEVEDPKGNKVFKKEVKTSEFGVASADFVLADEINLGDYRIRANFGEHTSNRTVSVQRYVLPKFRSKLDADKRFYLPKETIKGDLQVDYFFGKPVASGKVKVVASTFDVAFKEFATWEGKTDASGHTSFTIKVPEALVGLPLNKGNALVRLEVQVTDSAEHAETISRTFPVSDRAIQVSLIPEAGRLLPGLENRVFAAALYPDGSPAKAEVKVWAGKETKGKPLATVKTNEAGLAELSFTPKAEQFRAGPWGSRKVEMLKGVVEMGWMPSQVFDLTAEAKDGSGNQARTSAELTSEPAGENVLLRLDRAIYQGGETLKAEVRTTAGLPTVYLDVIKNGQLLSSRWLDVKEGKASASLDLPPSSFGTLEVHAYQPLRSGEIIRDSRIVYVSPATDLRIKVDADKSTYLPGSEGVIRFEVTDSEGKPAAAVLGVVVVDEAVYALQDMQPGLEKVYFTLQKELLEPKTQVVYRPGENLDTLVRKQMLPPQQQQVAQVLLTAVRPKPPARWQVDPASERQQKLDQQIQIIGQALYQQALGGKPAIVSDRKAGWLFRPGLLADVVKSGALAKEQLTDSLGKELTLEDISRAESGFTAEQLAQAVTRTRLQRMAGTVQWLAGAERAKYYKDGKFVPTKGMVSEAAKRQGLGVDWARDGWGQEFRLVKEGDKKEGMTVLQGHYLVSAGPDGKFGTEDDVSYQPLDEWQVGVSWYLPGGHRGLPQVARRLAGRGWHGGPRLFGMPGGPMPPGLPMPMAGPGGVGGGGAKLGLAQGAPGGLPPAKAPATAPKTDAAGAASGPAPEPTRLREYFPETLLWQPGLVTDEKGHATLKVPFADSITTWRLSASASSRFGALGGATLPLRVFQDFFVDIDLPVALTQNDEVAFPVAVYNYLKEKQTLNLELQAGDWFELRDEGGPKRTLELEPGQVTALRYRIRVKKVGRYPLQVTARGTRMSDAVKRSIEVLPDGRPIETVATDRLKGAVSHTISVPDNAIEGASRLTVKVYPGVASQLLEGAEGMMQMPNGCFEQTSSSAYPNVLVVDYIKKTRSGSPETLLRAETYLNAGYQRLLTFERPGGGFDWWGSGEPLVWLSAYGLQEFSDMAKVWPIDRGIIDRTRTWLLKQQGADGTWSNIGATHSVSIERMGDPKLLLTSYVAWSILEGTNQTPEWRKSEDYKKLKKAIEYIREQAPKAENAYILALAANALACWDAKDDSTFEVCKKVLGKLDGLKEARPEWKAACFPAKGQSLTCARDESLTVETTAMALLAMIRSGQFTNSVNQGLVYLVKSKGAHGTWGSTQATILSLKALAASSGGPAHKGVTPFAISVNGKEVAKGEVTEKNADVLQLFDLREHLRAGNNEVSLSVKGETNLLYQVVGRSFVPDRKGAEPVKPVLEVAMAYDRTKLTTSDMLKATATLRYHGKVPTYQVILDLPIPPGFVVDPGEFAELVAAKKVERFSVTARQVTLYLGDVKPEDVKTFEYVLRPKYPIKAKAPAAVAYEYYTPANRAATRPVELVVDAK